MTIIWPEAWEYMVICCLSCICLFQLFVLVLVFGASREVKKDESGRTYIGDQENQ